MLNASTLRMQDRQQLFRPLVNSTVHQFLADRVPPTVQDPFQMVNILDLLTIYQLLKSTTNSVTHATTGYISGESGGRFGDSMKSGTFVCTKATACLNLSDGTCNVAVT